MALWYAPTSPFARKVRIAAYEMGIDEQLQLVEVDPWSDARLRALNPLAKVPTIVMDDGEIVWESALIVERLSVLASRSDIIPAAGASRWRALSLQALVDGACAAAGRLYADERRARSQQAPEMLSRFRTGLSATLDYLESVHMVEQPTVGEISAAALLGYLDFRWPSGDWREDRPRLAKWFRAFSERPSMAATAHPAQPA